MPPVYPTRSYRATLIPAGLPVEEAEARDIQGSLPTIRVRAPSCGHAANAAHWVTGRPVLKVERVEPAGKTA